jgi:glycosyltransferase involved in cell wall biosynthesis
MAVDVVAFARSHLRSDVRDRLGIEPAENAVLFVGNLSKNKGIDFLLEAATLMMREVSDMKLILTLELEHKGFHERLEAVTKRIGELGIRDKVLRLGFVRDMPGLMAAADVVVLPFLTTSGIADHPMVALEAMAAHRPVIASRVGGVPEIVRDGDTGLLVPPGDSAKLAQALLALLRQPALRQELGARGGALVAQRFSIERVSALTEALYRELADANAAS